MKPYYPPALIEPKVTAQPAEGELVTDVQESLDESPEVSAALRDLRKIPPVTLEKLFKDEGAAADYAGL